MTEHKIMDTINLFPVPIGRVLVLPKITEEEKSFIISLATDPTLGNNTSTENYVLDLKEMARLKAFVLKSVNDYFKYHYQPHDDLHLRLTESWVSQINKNDYHHPHFHANSAFSGVMYIQTGDDDTITFTNPIRGAWVYETKEYTPYNANSWWLEARANQMLIFPSSLEHEVKVKETDGLRVSLAFNTFFVGKLGLPKGKTELFLS